MAFPYGDEFDAYSIPRETAAIIITAQRALGREKLKLGSDTAQLLPFLKPISFLRPDLYSMSNIPFPGCSVAKKCYLKKFIYRKYYFHNIRLKPPLRISNAC